MFTKCDKWPLVLSNDDGIRPIGGPDECAYCGQSVGEPHGQRCVTVTKMVRYGVLDTSGDRVGTYRRDDPHFWDARDCEFHKNDGTWCADNALASIEWESDEIQSRIREAIGDGCACNHLEFRFEAVEDEGPFVELRNMTRA